MADTTITSTPGYGWQEAIPEGTRAAYGGRWIVNADGHVDILGDRQAVCLHEGYEDMVAWLSDGALEAAKNWMSELLADGTVSPRSDRPFVLHQDRQGVIVGNCRASAGYCYVAGWMFAHMPEGSTTRGLECLAVTS